MGIVGNAWVVAWSGQTCPDDYYDATGLLTSNVEQVGSPTRLVVWVGQREPEKMPKRDRCLMPGPIGRSMTLGQG
jgi:hypothetical protein